MTAADRSDLLARLAAGRADLLASVEGMTDAEAAAPPAPGRWSAIGNIEHLAMVETNMVQGLKDAAPAEGQAAPGREVQIFEAVKARGRRIPAPEMVHPTGRIPTLAAAFAGFDAARAGTLAFVESCAYDPRRCSTTHPLLGPVTGMECLFLIAAHPFRHAAQIREARGQAG